jgi:iron complex outermembrane receptor protein
MVRLLACSSAALIAAMVPGAVLAREYQPTPTTSASDQSQPDEAGEATQVGDIVVTARRREEAIRDVPGTLTAVTEDDLRARGPLQGTGDLLATVPGVRFNGLQSENLAEVSVRGSGTQRATSADSGVGLFVNGAYVGSSTLGGRNFRRIDFFDLARVEALEGPQGALYGRNSEFGTVNIVLAQPAFRDSGRISATYINEQQQLALEGVVNHQYSDTIAVRVGAQVTGQTGGIYYNPNDDTHYDHTEGYIVRGQLRYNSGPLDINFLIDAQDMDLPTFANTWVLPAGLLAALPMGYSGPRYDIGSDVPNDLRQTVQRGMAIMNYDLGWGTLTSTTMVMQTRSRQNFAAAVDLATQRSFQQQGWVGLYPLGGTSTDARNRTFYQDIHIAGEADDGNLSWLAGFELLAQEDFYIRDQRTSPCALTAISGICGGTPTVPLCFRLTATSLNCPAVFPLAFGSRRVVPSSFDSAAVYGSVTYDLGNLSITGDLRYSRDEKQASQSDFRLYTTTPIGAPSSYEFEQGNWSYALTASYRLMPQLLLYARTGTGYRAGGVNNGTTVAVAPNPLQPTYDNEETTAYEIGLKSDITDNIFVRLSAYMSQTENAIASVSDGCTVLNVCGQVGSLFNINGGTAEVKGVEAALDSHFEVGPGIFRMNLNAAWQDAEFTEVTAAPGAPILGSAVAQTPEWTWSANFNYRMPLGADATGFMNVLYSAARGGIQDTVTATVPEIPLSDFDTVNLRVGVEHQRRTLALFVNNLTDQEVVVLRLQQGAIPLANRYSRPRTIGINLSYRW